ncbi:hypothetical protein [Actinomadura sp. HBU206391]|uniref:hypothetical protein n=1 Tax=Actinomadura sp. HBU206391 TaxID=2731692 RepID=UPI001650662C|nr:hypothetical protein [Actinomadura sp. HBU206391]MBC6457219.1 hypothetical protein [Actinomadura sp. HBU206391]
MSINEIVKGLEPAHRLPPMGEGTRELLAQITATPITAEPREPGPAAAPRRGHRMLRSRVAAPLVVALAAAVLIAGWFLPATTHIGPRPAAALDITREGDYYIVTVKDLFADPERYESQLRDLGLSITLRVEPVSPSLEGAVFPPFDMRTNGLSFDQLSRRKDLVSPIKRPGSCHAIVSCTIGLRIPVDYQPYRDARFKGKSVIGLGRKGRPGERYNAFGQLNNPGEPLACVDFVNQPVSRVTSLLREHHVVASFAVPLKGYRTSVPGAWFVHEGWLTEQGKALLVADSTRVSQSYPMSKACRKGS